MDRHVPKTDGFFVDGRTTKSLRVAAIEGQPETGRIAFKQLVAGTGVMMVEVFREKGMIDPVHNHPDHESICYLVRGRARVVIGGQEFLAEAGAAWIHPPGVDHFCEALEDCVQIEVKSPPRRTWDAVDDEPALKDAADATASMANQRESP